MGTTPVRADLRTRVGVQIARQSHMSQGTVVLAGSLPVQGLALDQLVAEFGWSLKQACDLRQLTELNTHHKVVAVLFEPRGLALSWDTALQAILDAAPGALPIV